ncbi:DNA mismatch repair protein Msh3-like [Uloborus diversus]|uniref:DNA mismatch repair protein Msh3-like n=2 Tax=Uloborus diversus TaxID=327109 RepID=UPI00240A86DD|nr:DNA mismatch repair protein Msh3-like [Uloborus diversus]
MKQSSLSKYFTQNLSSYPRKRNAPVCIAETIDFSEKIPKLQSSKSSSADVLPESTRKKILAFKCQKQEDPKASSDTKEDTSKVSSCSEKTSSRAVILHNYREINCENNSDTNHQKLDSKKEKYTPLEEQYLKIKNQYPDAVLLIECGYRYKLFGEDAEVASKHLNMPVYKKYNLKHTVINSGCINSYIKRLVLKGFKVGVVKQTESTALKAAGENRNELFTRELHSLYTKATLIDDPKILDSDETKESGDVSSDFLICINEEKMNKTDHVQIAVVAVGVCSGDVCYALLDDNLTRNQLEDFLVSTNPAEILYSSACLSKNTKNLLANFCNERSVRVENVRSELYEQSSALGNISKFLSGQETEDLVSETVDDMQTVLSLPPLIISCLSALVIHLKNFGLANILKNIRYIKLYSEQRKMELSAATVKGLELLENNSCHSEYGSLFWAINKTSTKFGERMLKKWISKPLKCLKLINERLDIVTEIIHSDSVIFKVIENTLYRMTDLEKILCSVLHGKCSCCDFLKLIEAFEKIRKEFLAVLDKIGTEIQTEKLKITLMAIANQLQHIEEFKTNINPEAAKENDKMNVFRDVALYPSVNDCKMKILSVQKELNDLRPEICKILRVPAIKYATVAGQKYLIEVSNDRVAAVPNDWLKINVTKHVSRFQSPEVIKLCKELDQQQEKLQKYSSEAWDSFLNEFGKGFHKYKKAVSLLAQLDCFLSFAKLAKENKYCRPVILDTEEKHFNIVQSRHPVVWKLIGDETQFVANDLHLNAIKQCAIITGPNMGGKSTFVRQIALIAIMSHIGCYVPVESATLPLLDGIYVRMGANDDLVHKKSTFMCEMSETSYILSKVSHNSFVVLDELGRGTSTHDGTAIAYATLEYILEKVKCLSLFVTHYPDVMELKKKYPENILLLHMAYIMQNEYPDCSIETVTFLYNVIEGICKKSYGINVAAMAGISKGILHEAQKKSFELQQKMELQRKIKMLILKINSR